ncbi:hypothetical protein ACQKH5_18535 [Hyphomonas sp. NPDC076900]|uniref:hypothetical protein n=1 Tax=unclassified Hyphomonas TaxID=2630699 RepID=UPI003CFC0903
MDVEAVKAGFSTAHPRLIAEAALAKVGGKVIGDVAEKIGGVVVRKIAAESRLLPSGVGGAGAAYNKATGQGLYVLRDEAGNIRYVGRGDAPARIQTRADSINKSELIGDVLFDNNLTKAQAKGLEQRLINEFGGVRAHFRDSPWLNTINSYSSTNPNAPLYRDAVTDALRQYTLKKVGR